MASAQPERCCRLGLPADLIAELGEIGWDLTPLTERVIVLHKAMDGGFIGVRGQSPVVAMEKTS
jgi:hypothetical protein